MATLAVGGAGFGSPGGLSGRRQQSQEQSQKGQGQDGLQPAANPAKLSSARGRQTADPGGPMGAQRPLP